MMRSSSPVRQAERRPLEKTLSLHEKTVQSIVGHGAQPVRRRYSGRSSAVTISRVHPLVMAAARRAIATGSYTRIEILSTTEVRVR